MTDTLFPERRTAVVTGVGGARGIGRVVARGLAAQGWSLGLIDISGDGVHQFTEELRGEGIEAVGVAADITSPDSVAAAYARFDTELPPLVGLVNMAGIPSTSTILDMTLDEWNRVYAVNATGSMLNMQAAGRRMIGAGVGRIVNVSSITALDGGGTFSKSGYAAAKAAVQGLTRGGAREFGPMGITVNCILPGPVDTDIMGGTLTDERKAGMSADIPVGRVGQPADIAAMAVFLLSEGASFVNGACINVDGGKHMH
ncbi:SDR family NAD(P)-dependent oxidoreductase [Subtercola boreus]|uniref:Short-chain dehydrogenase n=1 Tax=Subtercola boreus TaxID=120213 RepID=A0A3E0WA43_9MICO|nr:SDR family NAD(P)-dependent oxidoreductase [Subtercola boreus]RFA19352.1 short-chain dehydrogenase [Subtercola boreus]RFA19613.1 short-chain dehydrogenase [Subtercola boreus]RFA25979.1 short-chain dehydrogenase [Subtercola boreus]